MALLYPPKTGSAAVAKPDRTMSMEEFSRRWWKKHGTAKFARVRLKHVIKADRERVPCWRQFGDVTEDGFYGRAKKVSPNRWELVWQKKPHFVMVRRGLPR
jgi:hypothetical protein